MPTAAELYAAILADPDNLDLRLQYADAVADTDPDHAELIHLQIEDEQLGRQALYPAPDSVDRERQLAQSVGPRVARDLDKVVETWQLRRGFPEVAVLTAESFLRLGDDLFRRAPVRHLVLKDVAGHLDALAASPLLGRLRSLDLTGNPIGDAGVEKLISSPHLGNLRFLSLSRTGAGEHAARALAAADTLPNLQYLSFNGNQVRITPRPAAQDAVSGELVDVDYPPLGQELARQYGAKPWLTYTSPNPGAALYRRPDYGEV